MSIGKKRILYIGGFQLPDKNAAAHRVLGIGKSLRDIGYIVEFLDVSDDIEDNNLSAEWSCQGFSVYSQRHSRNNRQRIQYTCKPLHVEEVLDKHNDWNAVIAYNYPALALLKLKKICHKRGIRIFSDCTEWYAFDGKTIGSLMTFLDSEIRMRFVHKKLDGLIAISSFLGDYYQKYLPTVVVPPTVDLDEQKWHQDAPLKNNGLIVLTYAGSIGNSRNKDQIGIVIHTIIECGLDIRLNIVGVTEDAYLNLYPEDTDLLKEYTVRNIIVFHGRLHHEEALKILQGSDYCIFYRENTRLNRAGFPTKFVESISCGVPVITTRTSDLAQYINNRGFLLDQDQFLTQFTACIKQPIALSDKDRRLFSYTNFTDRIEILFRE